MRYDWRDGLPPAKVYYPDGAWLGPVVWVDTATGLYQSPDDVRTGTVSSVGTHGFRIHWQEPAADLALCGKEDLLLGPPDADVCPDHEVPARKAPARIDPRLVKDCQPPEWER